MSVNSYYVTLLEHDELLYVTTMVQFRTHLIHYFTSSEVTVLVFVDVFVFVNSQLGPEITKNKYYLHVYVNRLEN